MRIVMIALVMLTFTLPVVAQDEDGVPWPQAVEVIAPDGMRLYADFYPVDPSHQTVLLLHELYSNRSRWQPLLDELTSAGFNILAVDLRGYGQTRGRINWPASVNDVGLWLEWLRGEGGVRGDGISVIGSSMGSVLGITGCAADADCRTVIAISPGWNYHGIGVEAAFREGLGDRPALLIYSARDAYPARGVPRIMEVASEAVVAHQLAGNAHGMNLIRQEAETLLPLILEWLAAHGG